METDQEIQEEFTKAERAYKEAQIKFRNLPLGADDRKARKEYDKAGERLEEIKKKLAKETVLFAETFYFIKCGKCGREEGAYYDKPPKESECDYCGHVSWIDREIKRRPRY